MKQDSEVKLYMQARKAGKTQKLAAAKAGMSERTGRKYEQMGKLPSQLKQPRTWLTRQNPFEQDWDWVTAQLERDPALQATTLLALLIEQHPGRYRPTQIVTLRRHIAKWRALHGPEREVIFEQVHTPGERAQSDFTHMSDLGITIAGESFPHLIYHFVFTYSNVEAVTLCFSESFEALAEGIEHALWQLGGVPKLHRTDHLTAAVRQTHRKETREEWTARYQALMDHYGMLPTWNNVGIAHENGDVEQAHHRFKQALDQALRVRGSREFASRADYWHFVCDLVSRRNRTRAARWHEEQAALRPLPRLPLVPCKEVQVRVSRFSTIQPSIERVFRPFSADRHEAAGASTCRDHRGLCWYQTSLYPATPGRDASASHRLSSLHLVVGAQAWGLRRLSLPRRTVSQHDLSPCLRPVV
jgi:hypothetical protein